MSAPTVDIIVPVWNNLFETRACLAAIVTHTQEARLIVIDNGSSRETQVMLEEFSEPLGEKALFMASEKNLGLVPAINKGLERSDSDFAIIIRPHIQVASGWLAGLIEASEEPKVGIVSPIFKGKGVPQFLENVRGCTQIETFNVSFSALAIKRKMRVQLNGFDESLDGASWCLKDYIRQAYSKGFTTNTTSSSYVISGIETIFGSELRRLDIATSSQFRYQEKWGKSYHYAIYFGSETKEETLANKIEIILNGARQGHCYSLFLHNRHASLFKKNKWDRLHTAISVNGLSILMPKRDIVKQIVKLKSAIPEIIAVCGNEEIDFPGIDDAISFKSMASEISVVSPYR